jgi:ribosome-associated protein
MKLMKLRRAARTAGIRVPREEGRAEDGRWVLVDFGDTIVHLFDPEARRFYDIEHLWGDVPRLAWSGEKSA